MKAKFTPREYKGLIIEKSGINSSGIGYSARTGDGITLKADSLVNIKWMIRNYLYRKALGLH